MKLIIFDFDGVLVDTLGIVYSLDSKSNQNLSLEEYRSFYEGNIRDARRLDGTPAKFHPNFFSMYDEQTRKLEIPQELKNILLELSSNFRLVIVSSTSTPSIKNILEREGVFPFFSHISGSDIHYNKTYKIKMLLEKYEVLPEEAVYITDTVGDVKEARAAGLKSIAVTWGFHEEKTLQKAKPYKIVSTPEDLLKSIKEI